MQRGARRARPVDPPVPADAAATEAEVAPVLRVKRSRLAFALSVTVAALPVLVLDNLPASAERNEPIAVSSDAPADDGAASTTTTAAPASTTEPPAPSEPATAATLTAPTTAAPAPTTTTAPPQSEAEVVAVRAPAPPPPPTPTTAPPAPASTGQAGDPNDPASWDAMAQCEAGGNWSINTGNGYYGGLQFSLATWQSYGGTGYPHEASKATQIAIGKKLQADRGWNAWPGCARQLGYT
jgi:hypothetical protein